MNKLVILIVIILSVHAGESQTTEFKLSCAGATVYKNKFIVYGIAQDKEKIHVKAFALSPQGVISDSSTLESFPSRAEEFLTLSSDTLHGMLNIYCQKKNKNAIRVYRIDPELELLYKTDDIEPARLNNAGMLGDKTFYSDSCVYSIRMVTDSGYKQFYLLKYRLKKASGNFEYTLDWQFPFGRKNVESAELQSVHKQNIYVYARTRLDSTEYQWVLNIDAKSGKLVAGTRLNAKNENSDYVFGAAFRDSLDKSIHVAGMVLRDKTTAFRQPQLYYLQIDSTGLVISRSIGRVTMTQQTAKSKITAGNNLLRCLSLAKQNDGTSNLTADLFSGNDNVCFYYANTIDLTFSVVDEVFVLKRTNAGENKDIKDYYFSNDPNDLNGKICSSAAGTHPLFSDKIVMPVRLQNKKDDNGNRLWLLAKSNAKQKTIVYSFLRPVAKIYKIENITEIPKENNPVAVYTDKAVLVGQQVSPGVYQSKIIFW